MSDVQGTRNFQISGAAYDAFMGRYSRALAPDFLDFCQLQPGSRFLDVGCGPGALTSAAVSALGAEQVAAVDPAAGFVEDCRARHTGVDVRRAPAEQLPFGDAEFGGAAAQLVFHFVTDPARAAAEMSRVVAPGGVVAASVWDLVEGMAMLRGFWDAAGSLDPMAPDEARLRRFGGPGELAALFEAAGLTEIQETTLAVQSRYANFDELWAGFLHGVGPAGAYAVAQPPDAQSRLREAVFRRFDSPHGSFTLDAVARVARARVPVSSCRAADGDALT